MLAVSCTSSTSPAGDGSGPVTSGATSSSATFTVGSTLDGLTTLPHRIRWRATPSVSEDKVSEVDFLIDGRVAWVEHDAPYDFGDDGGYLVTTFLTHEQHSFIVRVIDVGGQSAESTVKASVAAAPSPPDGLNDMSWTRRMTASDRGKASSSEPPPVGRWGLSADAAGWMIRSPEGGGLLFDVAYRSDGRVEFRTSIERPTYPSPTGGAFCEEPDRSSLWTYTIGGGGTTLTLHPVSNDPCGDRLAILEGTWTSE
jgi:hypothetical protein